MLVFHSGSGDRTERCEIGTCKGKSDMKLFAASPIGEHEDGWTLEKYISNGLRHRLLSYADLEECKGIFEFWLSPALSDKKLFLDSGAFSAFNNKAVINLKDYLRFIIEHKDTLFCYASLDVIGDHKGTRKNYNIMRKAGLNPLPTFHAGSPFTELEYYCERNDFVALGGMVPLSRQQNKLRAFLNKSWTIIKKHWPIKIHAFGVTAQPILEAYPFYSCDSSAAIVGGGMGRMMVFKNGKLKNTDWKKLGKKGELITLVDNLGKEGSQHLARRIYNIDTFVKFEKYLTELWARRSIEWKD